MSNTFESRNKASVIGLSPIPANTALLNNTNASALPTAQDKASWLAWLDVPTNAQLNSSLAPYLTASLAADTYVPRSGGTMTGNLVVPDLVIGGVDGPRLNRSGAMIRARSNDGLSDAPFSAGAITAGNDGNGVSLYVTSGIRKSAGGALFIDNPHPNGDFVFRNGTGFSERLRIDASGNIIANGTIVGANSLRLTGNNPQIGPSTQDGTDNQILYLTGGGGFGPTTRGPHIGLHGIDATTRPGNLELHAGQNGEVRIGGEQGGGHVVGITVAANGNVTSRNIDVRNGLNAMQLLVQNTWTNDTNRETGFARWVNNVFQIGTERAGTGVARALTLQTSGVNRLFFRSGEPAIEIGNGANRPIILSFAGTSSFAPSDGSNLSFFSQANNDGDCAFAFTGTAVSTTASSYRHVDLVRVFSPTSGNASYSFLDIRGQVNQTGGANGVTRGVNVMTSLLSAADWRSFDTNVNSGFAYHSSGSAPSRFGGNVFTSTRFTAGTINSSPAITGEQGDSLVSIGTELAATTRLLGFGNNVRGGAIAGYQDGGGTSRFVIQHKTAANTYTDRFTFALNTGDFIATGHITSAFQTLSTDPSTIDIPSGSHRRVKNTTSGEVRDWVNDGGIMRRSPAYT